jgi:AICAR transformylase/IMP cyclohydrolase PurH
VSKKTILQTYLDDKNNKHIGLFTTATAERLKQETKTAIDKYKEYKTYAESLDDKVLRNAVSANEANILKQSKFAEATKDLNQELLKDIKYNTDYNVKTRFGDTDLTFIKIVCNINFLSLLAGG